MSLKPKTFSFLISAKNKTPTFREYEPLVLVDEENLKADYFGLNELVKNPPCLDMLLYMKDKFNISNSAWNELETASKGLPSFYSLKKNRSPKFSLGTWAHFRCGRKSSSNATSFIR